MGSRWVNLFSNCYSDRVLPLSSLWLRITATFNECYRCEISFRMVNRRKNYWVIITPVLAGWVMTAARRIEKEFFVRSAHRHHHHFKLIFSPSPTTTFSHRNIIFAAALSCRFVHDIMVTLLELTNFTLQMPFFAVRCVSLKWHKKRILTAPPFWDVYRKACCIFAFPSLLRTLHVVKVFSIMFECLQFLLRCI